MRTLVLLLAVVVGARAEAQSDWTTVQQPATWLNAFVEHDVGERTALWLDAHLRRDGLGRNPQQVLIRPGLLRTLRPGLRAGGGYAYIATAPYGLVPLPQPTREHRLWQQLTLAQRLGPVGVSHRLRWEQRWVAAELSDGGRSDARYQQRARYSVRAQRPLPQLRLGERDAVGFIWDEVFIPVGHSDGAQRRLQNRVGAGLGLPLTDRQRLEVGYMHQWNRITPRTTHEVNHTLVLSWVWTAGQ